MKLSIRFAVLAAAVAAIFPAHADEQKLAPVVVTATRQETRANELVNDVSVLYREDIEQAGPAATLGEVLSRLPGIEFIRTGSRGAGESIFIRGTNAGHALVLIDGMRVGSATTGSASISTIPLMQIQRVEVLRGTGSAVYGSDAIGGVINIITKNDAPQKLSVEIGGGSHGTYSGSVATGAKLDDWTYQFRYGENGSHGVNSVASSSSSAYNPDKDGYWQRSASADVGYKISPKAEVGFQYLLSEGENKFDSSSPNKTADLRYSSRVASANAFGKIKVTEAWDSTLRLGHSIDESKQTPSSTSGKTSDDFNTARDQLTWQNDVRLPLGRLLAVVERLEESAKTTKTAPLNDVSRSIDSYSLGWNGVADAHRWQINVRNDKNSQYGSKTTGNLGYGYQLNSTWRVAGSVGTAFKAPSFNDLYWPGAGNTNLLPESSRNRELGLHYENGKQHISLTRFRNDIKNLIDWAPIDPNDSNSDWIPQNVNKARIEGWTLAHEQQLGNWRLSATYNAQDPRDAVTGKLLRRRASKFGSLGADWTQSNLSAGAELSFAGRRFDDVNNKYAMGGYSLVNLRASYSLNKEWAVFGRVDNLFDKHYVLAQTSDHQDYAVLGTTAFVGLRYSLK